MRPGRSFAALQLAAVAAVSVLVGHWAGYLAAVPDAGLRETVLLDSGHAYWVLAVKLAMLLGVASLAASGFDAVRRGVGGAAAPEAWTLPRALVALLTIQLGSFTILEVSERVLAGEPLTDLVHHNVFAWGLLAQLLIAPLGALLLVWLGRALRRIVSLVSSHAGLPIARATAVALPSLARFVPARDWRGAFATRGPPA